MPENQAIFREFFLDKVVFRQYLIIIAPPTQIDRDVQFFKRSYRKMFGDANKVHSRPHFSVLSFVLDQSREATLRRELSTAVAKTETFPLSIKGFNGFPNNHLVFLDVEEPFTSFNNLQNELLVAVRKRVVVNCKHAPKPGSKAHMTIALGRSQKQFEFSSSHFKAIDYQKDFNVDTLTVISREVCEEVHGELSELWQSSRWETNFEIALRR